MATEVTLIRVANAELGNELIGIGQRMISLGLNLRDYGFEVPIEYNKTDDEEE